MRPVEATPAPLRVVLLGNPNAGKSTLFNALTGLRQRVANYPGVTVERRHGWWNGPEGPTLLADLPGIYSLSARSPEEEIAAWVLGGADPEFGTPDLVLAVADATALERHLYLACQLLERGVPVVLALSMMDLAEARGIRIDAQALSKALGIPVIPVNAPKREGLEALRLAVSRRPKAPSVAPAPSGGGADPPRGESAAEAVRRRYVRVREACARAVDRRDARPHVLTESLDRVLTHRVAGLALFAAVMLAVFYTIFSLAETPMGWIEAGQAWLQGAARAALGGMGLGGGPVEGLLADGIIGGAGTVVVFLPQILLLFLFIAILEDSGYMARAAFLMDRLMRGVGLHGRSFIPLMSSFACAVPGIMATRTIENRKDRLATILVAPLMSCSARLPVYSLMILAFFPAAHAALIVVPMYFLGLAMAFAAAWVFKRTLLKGPPPPFVMELPDYRVPSPAVVLRSMWDRSYQFLRRAGTVILAISIVLWYLSSRPVGEPLERSWLGRMGRAVEPALRPLGFDWRLGIGVLASFAAREVLVTTLATLHHVEGLQALAAALRPHYTPLTAVGLMVFFVLACQCMSTVAVVRRETGSWRWPAFMVAYMTALAYLASLAVYQVGSRMGWGLAT